MLPVDQEERQRKIAEVTVDIIAREGLEAATFRRIAAAIGCSTAVITHYFAGKRELLLWTYKALAQKGHDRVEEVMARDPADLLGGLLAMTAADEHSLHNWRVYVAFLDWAARDSVFAEEQRLHMNIALDRIAKLIRARNGDRSDIAETSRQLNALVQGISIQALIDRACWSGEQIARTLAQEIESLLGGPLRLS